MKNKKVLGIVNWYSKSDGFGVIASNSKNINTAIETYLPVFVYHTKLKQNVPLEEGDWVSFIPSRHQGKDTAEDVKELSFTKEDIALAFEYRKDFVKIKGRDKKNAKSFDVHVIESIYNFVSKKDSGAILFKTAFYEYIDRVEEIFQDFVIHEFFEDELTAKVLIDIVRKEIVIDENLKSIDKKVKAQLFNFLLNSENCDWNILARITDFDSLQNKREVFQLKIQHDILIRRDEIRSFLAQIGIEGMAVLWEQINVLESDVLEVLYENFGDNLFSVFQKHAEISDELRFLLFLSSGDEKYLNFKDTEKVTAWLIRNKSVSFEEFIRKYVIQAGGTEKVNDFLSGFESLFLANKINTFMPDEQLQILTVLPTELTVKIINEHVLSNTVADEILSAQWEIVKSEVPYVVFDLEISEEEKTKELKIASFAFSQEGNLREYEGEEQLNTLNRALKKNKIIVGHNIKQWDLPILSQKGIEPQSFVWDTLEMEILLNPCRYAYSLKTVHKAKEDTQLTEELFWNQLYRLAQQESLCNRLKKFLPEDILLILKKLSIKHYKDFFYNTANRHKQFFQELLPIDKELEEKLKQLAVLEEKILIVAPKSLWGRLAHYLPLHFISDSENKEFLMISADKLKNKPFDDLLAQTVLLRFCEETCTPIIGNLAVYLRITDEKKSKSIFSFLGRSSRTTCKIGFSEEDLFGYLSETNGKFDCVDIDSFENTDILAKQYQKIYLIGSELQDRIHLQCVRDNITVTELLQKNSQLPMQMASCNYVKLNKSEYAAFGIKENPYTANIWVERKPSGLFAVYMNYKYLFYRKNFLDKISKERVELDWKFDRQHTVISPCFAGSVHDKIFDNTSVRVNSSSPLRSKYWVYQIALLNKIYNNNPDLPIIYLIDDAVFNDKEENQALHGYLREQGFYIPNLGSGFSKLEYVSCHKKSILIVSKSTFVKSYSLYRVDTPFCIVWDNLDIDRYKLMWETLPFERKYKEIVNADKEDTSKGTTAKQCIISFLPILEYYYSIALANNVKTLFYVIEPCLDDYNEFDGKNNIKRQLFNLWKNEEDYRRDLKTASEYFKDYNKNDFKLDTVAAMEMISKFFIGGHSWREEQKVILPHMLQKKGDCLVSIPTGGGKSVLFQGPVIYRSMINKKLSLVITPLKALMQDQVYDLQKKGFGSCIDYLNSDRSFSEVQQIYRRIRSGDISLLFITPERFRVQSFTATLNQRIEVDSGLDFIIFDEAHCISQWGNEFRPDYHNAFVTCLEFKKKYDIMLALFSATFTVKEEKEIQFVLPGIKRLGQMIEDYNPIRQHIDIEFEMGNSEEEKILKILEYIKFHNIDFNKSKMLVFCRKRKECEDVAELLDFICSKSEEELFSSCAGRIGYYHAGLNDWERADIYNRFKNSEGSQLYILCTTKAFGMGMDIPNIHYIMHYNCPSVLEDYLQEVGRAGRNEKLYQEAFPRGKKIPACCMVTQKDFNKLKELLLSSLLSWSDLTEAKASILSYISQFRELSKGQINPVVVPYDVWLKRDSNPEDLVASKLIFYWLETIGYIKQRYLKPAHLDITFLDKIVPREVLGQYSVLYHGIIALTKKDFGRVQVSLQDLKDRTSCSVSNIVDGCLYLSEYGYITLNETIHCFLEKRRDAETKYMVERNENLFALRITFDTMHKFLHGIALNEELIVKAEMRENIIKECMEELNNNLDPVVHSKDVIIQNKKQSVEYMPWEGEIVSGIKRVVYRRDTFCKDIEEKTLQRIMNILNHIPGINIVDDIEIQRIRIKTTEWREFIVEMEKDCFTFLHYIVNNDSLKINWVTAMKKCGIIGKGFQYFTSLLYILKRLEYIKYTPPLKTGVEIYTTPLSEKDIEDGLEPGSSMYGHRQEFNTQERIKKIRLACMNAFAQYVSKENRSAFIKRYFQCQSAEEYYSLLESSVPSGDKILTELNEEALITEEDKIRKNPEQWEIYNYPINEHINVLAGPGSGKTHILTMRCARLIYKEHVDPNQILVLAYNRAVVLELKTRLDMLFSRLGLSKFAYGMNVFTFHAFAKKVMGQNLESLEMKQWENAFLSFLKEKKGDFKSLFPFLKYVLIDEFQDVTQARMDILLQLLEFYPDIKFFTIGDINQSIYGYTRIEDKNIVSAEEYARLFSPETYYNILRERIKPVEKTLSINYRSYPKILDFAKPYRTNEALMPVSSDLLKKNEPKDQYVYEFNYEKDKAQWFNDVTEIMEWAKKENLSGDEHRKIQTIAVFFRSNDEVFKGYSRIKDKFQDNSVRIRIQGKSAGELWRKREIYLFMCYLKKISSKTIVPHEFKQLLYTKCKQAIEYHINREVFYYDLLYTVALEFLEVTQHDDVSYVYADFIEFLKDITSDEDNGQLFKIYDKHKKERIIKEGSLTVVLTTMHKVKGLEFDVVIVAPSFSSLPFVNEKEHEMSQQYIQVNLEEERRLAFVAYTRAKKRLYVYKYKREESLDNFKCYEGYSIDKLGIFEKKLELKNYYLSFAARPSFNNHELIQNEVKVHDPVMVKKREFGNDVYFYIVWKNDKGQEYEIGSLSSSSYIAKQMKDKGLDIAQGYFVNDILVWTYEDLVKNNEKNKLNYASRWSKEAQDRGFVYVIDIAGYGKKV